MTRDDIIRMAREAGFNACNGFSQLIVRHSNGSWVDVADQLERFAALVAAAEREACASIVQANAEACDTYSTARRILESNAAAIRARSNT